MDKGKEFFCKDCAMEIPNDKESLQWHKDLGHRVVPRNQVTVEGEDRNRKEKRTPSKILYDFALSRIRKLIISENDSEEVFALVAINGHMEVLNLSSSRAIHWIRHEYTKHVDPNEIHSDDFYRNVLHSIMSDAHMNGTQKRKVYIRSAQLDDSLWYDLGTPNWQMIKITKNRIMTVRLDESSPIFRRSQSMFSQYVPKHGMGDHLEKLADLLRILPEDRIVFKVHLVCMFLESVPTPIMVFDGSAGSIKTTATAAIKAIVDPSGRSKEDNVSIMSEKADDLILQLNNRYLSSFDNVSRIDERTSDILCRAITGSSNPKRKLYTNSDETIYSFKRKIILNGIIPTLEYPDLQTRILNYPRIEINDSNRLTEREFHGRLHALIPYVLGQIFIILSKTLKKMSQNDIAVRPKERMADFEVWGEAISQVMGNEKQRFLLRYYEKLREEKLESQDAYPIISTIVALMDNKRVYEDTASNLHAELSQIAEGMGIDIKSRFTRFPKSSNKLAKHVKVVEPYLKSLGIDIISYHYTRNDGKFTKHAAIIRISRKDSGLESFAKVSSPSSPSSPGPDLGTKSGEDTGEDTVQRCAVSSPHGGDPAPDCSQSSPDPSSAAKNGPFGGAGEDTGEDKITVSSPKMADSRHEIPAGEDGEDGEDTFAKLSSQKYYICWTCNEKGTEPVPVSHTTPNGITLEHHRRAGHTVQFLTPKEARIVRDYYIKGGLRPEFLRH